jgi:hypothetical protein
MSCNLNDNIFYRNSYKISESAVFIINSLNVRAVGSRAFRYATDRGLCDHATVHCVQCHPVYCLV